MVAFWSVVVVVGATRESLERRRERREERRGNLPSLLQPYLLCILRRSDGVVQAFEGEAAAAAQIAICSPQVVVSALDFLAKDSGMPCSRDIKTATATVRHPPRENVACCCCRLESSIPLYSLRVEPSIER